MKSTLIAALVLASVLFFVIFNAVTVVRIAEEYENAVAAVEITDHPAGETEKIEQMYADFLLREKYISLSVSHEDLTNIEGTFAEWIGACRADDYATAEEMKSRLCDAFRHLGRLAKCNPDSIF